MIAKVLNNITKRTMIMGIAVALILPVFGYSTYIPGLLLGIVLGLLNLHLLAKDAKTIINGGNRSRNRIIRNFFIRYAGLAVILVAYCGVIQGSIASCLLGFVLVQIATYWAGAVE